MKKIIAVVNDNTGKAWAVDVGHRYMFPDAPIWAIKFEMVKVYGEFGEQEIVNIYWDDVMQTVDTRNYSIVRSKE